MRPPRQHTPWTAAQLQQGANPQNYMQGGQTPKTGGIRTPGHYTPKGGQQPAQQANWNQTAASLGIPPGYKPPEAWQQEGFQSQERYNQFNDYFNNKYGDWRSKYSGKPPGFENAADATYLPDGSIGGMRGLQGFMRKEQDQWRESMGYAGPGPRPPSPNNPGGVGGLSGTGNTPYTGPSTGSGAATAPLWNQPGGGGAGGGAGQIGTQTGIGVPSPFNNTNTQHQINQQRASAVIDPHTAMQQFARPGMQTSSPTAVAGHNPVMAASMLQQAAVGPALHMQNSLANADFNLQQSVARDNAMLDSTRNFATGQQNAINHQYDTSNTLFRAMQGLM